MDHHPIPRQITTFEFKLIGFLTLKQFGYLAFASIFAFIFFMGIPIRYVNIIVALPTVLIGVAFAFAKINERPLDIWIRNFVRKLVSPSQYSYLKHNQIPAFLQEALTTPLPIIKNHIDAQQKLSAYMNKGESTPEGNHAGEVRKKLELISLENFEGNNHKGTSVDDKFEPDLAAQATDRPFLYGLVKNRDELPLPNVLLYIKDKKGDIVRILKTNHNGIFATYHPLQLGHYVFEVKDLGQRHYFDTMNFDIQKSSSAPIHIFSKELI